MKKCSKCGIEKSFNCFHRDKNSKDGYRLWCKECRKKETKGYREKHREKVLDKKKDWYESTKLNYEYRNKKAQEQGHKICSECNVDKTILDFRQRANGGYYSKCKSCENKKNKIYAQKNPETIRQLKVISEHRRRGKISIAGKKTISRKDWAECKDYFDNKCAYCGREMQNLTQDHFIPVSRGGDYSKENIVPSCKSCNCKKHMKNFYEWYKTYEYYSTERENKILEYLKVLK